MKLHFHWRDETRRKRLCRTRNWVANFMRFCQFKVEHVSSIWHLPLVLSFTPINTDKHIYPRMLSRGTLFGGYCCRKTICKPCWDAWMNTNLLACVKICAHKYCLHEYTQLLLLFCRGRLQAQTPDFPLTSAQAHTLTAAVAIEPSQP